MAEALKEWMQRKVVMSSFEPVTATLDTLIDAHFDDARDVLKRCYGEILLASHQNATVPEYCDRYLRPLAEIYGATAAAVWFFNAEQDELRCAAQRGLPQLGLTGEYDLAHQRLLQFASEQQQAIWVGPQAAPAAGAEVSNPSDSFLVLGPVAHAGKAIGVVEVLLGPRPVRGQSPEIRQGYTLLLEVLVEPLLNFLLEQMVSLPQALLRLEAAQHQIREHQRAIRMHIQQAVQMYAGRNFGSLADNQKFATNIHELLDANALRAACPECGLPAIVRCQRSGSTPSGLFVFDHYLERGRTFHGGSKVFPKLQIVARPARRSRKTR